MKKSNEMLLFECAICKKEIEPLTFFDGSIWCPKCRKNLFAELKKKDAKEVEEDKDDFFGISQDLFARYLMLAANNPSATAEARACLRHAIAFCRKSAYRRNPYALLNLGYYYSLGYDESVHVETGRSFARLCFDLARKNAGGDEDLLTMISQNEKSVVERIEKGGATDLFYLSALLERFDSPIKDATPRLGVFHLSSANTPEEKKVIIGLLGKMYDICSLYLYNKEALKKNSFTAIRSKSHIPNVFASADPDGYWFAYVKKKEPSKAYKSALAKKLKDENEILENLTAIRTEVAKNMNKGVDFSDQDIFVCTFNNIYEYYDMERHASDTPFDRLSACYHTVNGI